MTDVTHEGVRLRALRTAAPAATPVTGELVGDVKASSTGILYSLVEAFAAGTTNPMQVTGRVPADGDARAMDALDTVSVPYLYNDAAGAYSRARGVADNADGLAPIAVPGLPRVWAEVAGFEPNLGVFNRVVASNDNSLAAASRGLHCLFTVARFQIVGTGGNYVNFQAVVDNADAQPSLSAGGLPSVVRQQVWNGASYDLLRRGNLFATALVSAAGSTQILVPPAGDFYRLMAYSLELSEDATLAAAGRLTAQFFDGAVAIPLAHTWFVPAVAVAGIGSEPVRPLDLQNGFLSAAAATALNLNLSAALTTGQVRVNVCYLRGAFG